MSNCQHRLRLHGFSYIVIRLQIVTAARHNREKSSKYKLLFD